MRDCPKCSSSERSKAGFVGEVQRWLCKSCGCKVHPQHTAGEARRGEAPGAAALSGGDGASGHRAGSGPVERRGSQMDPGAWRGGGADAQASAAAAHGHDRRGLAFHSGENNQCWLWISLCHLTGRILGVHLGGRGAEDLKAFLAAYPEARGQIAFTVVLRGLCGRLAAWRSFHRKNAHTEVGEPQRQCASQSGSLRTQDKMRNQINEDGLSLRSPLHDKTQQ